jgi:hypothetical protein
MKTVVTRMDEYMEKLGANIRHSVYLRYWYKKVQILTLKAVHQQADGGGGGEHRQGAPLNLLAVLVHKY